ncbi:MAG TPA: hypothetical protein VKF61_08220 [Candidatus Polarisedimenticolia bacterium]|nr:hypothetical protein [Candidatus Polarisedimenticolia bacterium]
MPRPHLRALFAGLLFAGLPAIAIGPAAFAAGAGKTLVVCAPGYPGTTEAAQPTMDQFARLAAAGAGLSADSLHAFYFETADGGLKRLAQKDAALGLLSLPLYLQQETSLKLTARLQPVAESGALETWSLAARRGRIASPVALDGWEITGGAGYAPEFVRGPILGGWGALPATSSVTFTANVLSALRRAAAGDPVAVILDRAQAKGLESLPFAPDLEIVARSAPMPAAILCSVGGRLSPKQVDALVHGFAILNTRPDSAELLSTMKLARFEPVDRTALDAARRSFIAARASTAAH